MPKKSAPRENPTHFLCLPLLTPTSTPQLAKSLAEFRSDKSSNNGILTPDSGATTHSSLKASIPKAAYRPVGTLHLTLGVMVLPTPERLQAALELLQYLSLAEILSDAAPAPESALKSAIAPAQNPQMPLQVSLQRLLAFPNPESATVLHAQPHDPTARLENYSLAVRQPFIDAGFMQPDNRPLVLHATLVNTMYAKKAPERRGVGMRRGRGRLTMDAAALVEAYKGHVWADEVDIDRVRICKMGARDVEDQMLGQEYEVVGEKLVFSNHT